MGTVLDRALAALSGHEDTTFGGRTPPLTGVGSFFVGGVGYHDGGDRHVHPSARTLGCILAPVVLADRVNWRSRAVRLGDASDALDDTATARMIIAACAAFPDELPPGSDAAGGREAARLAHLPEAPLKQYYWRYAALQARLTLPRRHPDPTPRQYPPRRTDAEYARVSRARIKRDEYATARWALSVLVNAPADFGCDELDEWGLRLVPESFTFSEARELVSIAVAAPWLDYFLPLDIEVWGGGHPWPGDRIRVPRRPILGEVLRELFGEPRTVRGVRYYRRPDRLYRVP